VYRFRDVAPGIYTISEELQAGWTETCPSSPGVIKVEVKNADITSADFGNSRAAVGSDVTEQAEGNSTADNSTENASEEEPILTD
jgi:hypothetical protein